MAAFVRHESCPRCGSRDNLGRYNDGSAWCFGCQYRESRTHVPYGKFREVGQSTSDDSGHSKPIPDDAGTYYGKEAVDWLGSYRVDVPTAVKRGLVWSPRNEQLIFQLGNVWQARNFGTFWKEKVGKCYTSGNINECLHIYGALNVEKSPQRLVIVEDPVSAIRIANCGLRIGAQSDTMPLLGSHLAQTRLNAIARLYSSVMFWLDSDKYKEARAMEQRAKYMGLSARTIYTDEDPKCYTNVQLQEILKSS